MVHTKQHNDNGCTDKKESQIFIIYKEIQNGGVAKSYMTNYMTLQLLHSEFPYIWRKFDFLFLSVQPLVCFPVAP